MRRPRPGTRPTAFSCPAPADRAAVLLDGEPAQRRSTYGAAGRDGAWMACRPPDAAAIEARDAVYVLRHGRQTMVRRAIWGPAISTTAAAMAW